MPEFENYSRVGACGRKDGDSLELVRADRLDIFVRPIGFLQHPNSQVLYVFGSDSVFRSKCLKTIWIGAPPTELCLSSGSQFDPIDHITLSESILREGCTV